MENNLTELEKAKKLIIKDRKHDASHSSDLKSLRDQHLTETIKNQSKNEKVKHHTCSYVNEEVKKNPTLR